MRICRQRHAAAAGTLRHIFARVDIDTRDLRCAALRALLRADATLRCAPYVGYAAPRATRMPRNDAERAAVLPRYVIFYAAARRCCVIRERATLQADADAACDMLRCCHIIATPLLSAMLMRLIRRRCCLSLCRHDTRPPPSPCRLIRRATLMFSH